MGSYDAISGSSLRTKIPAGARNKPSFGNGRALGHLQGASSSSSSYGRASHRAVASSPSDEVVGKPDPITEELEDDVDGPDREEYEELWDRMNESVNGPIAP